MVLIGISGKKQSGKDTCAQLLRERFPLLTYERIAFADALKEEVSKATGKSRTYIEENKGNFRLILQGWGTDFRRKLCGDDYWCEQWAKKVIKTEASLVIAPDVRFENEASVIHNSGGFLIRVNRPELQTDDHPSERALDNYRGFDFVVNNDGPVKQMGLCLDEIVRQIKGR